MAHVRVATREQLEVTAVYVAQIVIWWLAECYSPVITYGSAAAWFMRATLVLAAVHTYAEWSYWQRVFSVRVSRGDPQSPSNLRRPDTGTRVCGPSTYGSPRCRFSTLPKEINPAAFAGGASAASHPAGEMRAYEKEGRVARRGSVAIGMRTALSPQGGAKLSSTRAKELDMDHVYLDLSDWLWTAWFVAPPMYLGMFFGGHFAVGIVGILWNKLKKRLGVARSMPTSECAARLVEFCINSSMVVWSYKDGNVLRYEIPGVTHIDAKTGRVTAGTLALKIDITEKSVFDIVYKDTPISVQACAVLVFNCFAGHTHPVIHSCANWGINPDCPDWFIRRMSVISVKYNHMGLHGWPLAVTLFKRIGLLETPLGNDQTRLTCHMNHNVPNHAHLREFRNVSQYSSFILDVHRHFLLKFEEYAQDFPGIDGEALFVGTVLHAIDHCQAAKIMGQPLLEMGGEPQYAADHEWAVFTVHTVVDRPPGRPFECRMSHAPHPLFKETYKYGAKRDKELAGYMECCIAE